MNTILVALQMGMGDESVFEWSRLLCDRLGDVRRVVLVGLDSPIEMEEEIRAYVPELLEESPPVASLHDYLEEQRRLCTTWAPQIETELRRGDPWRELLAAALDIGADLVVLPRSLGSEDDLGASTMAARRVLRKVPCDALCVGAPPPAKLLRALVPIDFSARSIGALRLALRLVREDGRVTAVHVFRVPRGVATMPAQVEEIAARLETGTLEKLEQIAANEPLAARRRIDVHARQSTRTVAESIAEAARTQGAELICIGSRGRTPLAALALGSVAEALIENADQAVLVHKEKGETMGLLEALGI